MRILLIKTSSLGDIIHTFPAVSDAIAHMPHLTIDWVVEESFKDIPCLHPSIHDVIPVAMRRWRKSPFSSCTRQEIAHFIHQVRQTSYDAIIDAQGLFKSVLLSMMSIGPRWGFDAKSAREGWATWGYHHKISLTKDLDALSRIRHLFAQVLGYPCPQSMPMSGLIPSASLKEKHLIFLPGTTWQNKKWPSDYWVRLAKIVADDGFKVHVPWSNDEEQRLAIHIQEAGSHVTVLPQMTLKELAACLPHYQGAIAVDSGLGYLTAAYQVSTVMVFGPTTPDLLGTFPVQENLKSTLWCAPCRQRTCHNHTPASVWPPCFEAITPERVWSSWQNLKQKCKV